MDEFATGKPGADPGGEHRGKQMGNEQDYDRIRDAELNRHLDSLFSGIGFAETFDLADRQQREESERVDSALSEILDIQRLHALGTLDYVEAAGVLLEYMPEVLRALTTLQAEVAA